MAMLAKIMWSPSASPGPFLEIGPRSTPEVKSRKEPGLLAIDRSSHTPGVFAAGTLDECNDY
jgi:hypothetical protein